MKKFLIIILSSLFLLSACTVEAPGDNFPDPANGQNIERDYYTAPPDYVDLPELEPELEYEPEPEPEPIEITIQFAGDALLHTGPVAAARTNGNTYDFKPFLTHIRPFITGDLNLINMETPVDAYGENQNLSGWPRFNVPLEVLEAIDYAGFNHLIAANNHTFDRGFSGMRRTLENFALFGLPQTGMYLDEESFNTPTIIDVRGINVGIIAYADSANGLESLVPSDVLPFAMRRFRSHVMDDVPAMLEDIEEIRAAGAELVIISLHWGPEYTHAPQPGQRQIAEALAEGGADIIMGHHSHTPQPVRWHEREDGSRAFIMYSLGNFLADQTRLNDPARVATQYGMLITVNAEKTPNGEIVLTDASVLPTLCMRDRTGADLGGVDMITVLPLIDGEVPDFITEQSHRDWGRRAWEHVVNIVGEEFIG